MSMANPGTITDLITDEENKLKCLFFALGACIEGFKEMRKVIAVDGTFLKTTNEGTSLFCTAQDGNKYQYPLAFAVVKSESDESWNWFLVNLRSSYLILKNWLLFQIDTQESLKKFLMFTRRLNIDFSNVYKKAKHRLCAWHISQNVKSRINRSNRIRDQKDRGKVQETVQVRFMATAAIYIVAEFKRIYTDLTNRYPTTHEHLEDSVDVKKCARCYFVGSVYNILTTNGAESINSTLKTGRTYSLIQMIDAILMKICKWFTNHRKEAGEDCSSQRLTPMVETVLHARYQESTYLKTKELNSITCGYYV